MRLSIIRGWKGLGTRLEHAWLSLASFPGRFCGGEEKRPGHHCWRMRVVPIKTWEIVHVLISHACANSGAVFPSPAKKTAWAPLFSAQPRPYGAPFVSKSPIDRWLHQSINQYEKSIDRSDNRSIDAKMLIKCFSSSVLNRKRKVLSQ